MTDYQKIPSRADLERKYGRRRSDGFLHVLLFYILPFLIFNGIVFFLVTARPRVTLEVADSADYLTTQATVSIRSLLPVRSITANLDGDVLDLGEPKNRTYTVTITKNGVLEADVVNFNGMTAAQFEHIDILDDNPPTIEDARIENGVVMLTLTDSQSGLDSESVYAVDSAGERVKAITADPASGTWSFAMDPSGLYVRAQDLAGNEVQGTFTSHTEGGKETLQTVTSSSQDSAE